MILKKFKLFIVTISILLSNSIFSQEIFTAIMQGNIDKTKELIAADSLNVSIKNPRGFSPIHFAANFKHLNIAKLLVENGADPFVVGAFGRKPIHWAAAGGSSDILLWLKELGADLNAKDATGKTPIYLAATRGQKKSVDYLLSQNVEIQTSDDGAFELIYFSITLDQKGIINKFLESDFNFKEVSEDRTSLLLAAALAGNTELISTLVEQGLDINHLNDFGECALHIAIINKHFDAMKKLIELDANIHLENFIGKNALSFAKELDTDQFVAYLKTKGAVAAKILKLDKIYPDFSVPGQTPKLLAPGLISTSDHNERDIMFDPNMNEFYFSRHWVAKKMQMTIKKMTRTNQVWSEPETAKFSGKYSDAECFISHDNKNLYLISMRPQDGSDQPSNWEIWTADRINGDWDNFRLFDTTNLKGCFYPSLTKDGELLYTTGKNKLMLATLKNGKVESTKMLGPEINTEGGGYNAMISPNGDYIIFTSHAFKDHYGGGDLYISFRKEDDSWTPSINMGPEINSDATEYCPNVSPDEKYFFFTSNKKGTEDIYWMDASIISELKKKSLTM